MHAFVPSPALLSAVRNAWGSDPFFVLRDSDAQKLITSPATNSTEPTPGSLTSGANTVK